MNAVETTAREDLQGMFAKLRQQTAEHREAAKLARGALERLILVMNHKTGQAFKLRALLYSLWNGQPASLLDVVALDWELRKDLVAVVLAFGYENRGCPHTFFYDQVKAAVTRAGLWQWFLEEGEGAR